MKSVVLMAVTASVLTVSAMQHRPAAAQEYVLPQEEAEKRKPKPNPDDVQQIEVEAGKMQIVRIPVEDLKRAVVMSSHPEVADVHVEEPGMLFVNGRTPGQTVVVIADDKKNPVYTGKIIVVLPEDQGG
ncbi:pilus assembly protein N-terminal domain-containing protein [Insolitispirillum peregrinum]|uniref:Pilus formation protein N terminal region n=1 Tax=Insolitispirillum peregrinum TaxID=80876 RepID=A0A1N7LLP1_9PROT|nr:pilus assembly protein N-terminal domain-containing protein [Insolitispirillum peregrinum]SIS74699.1 Pilus formation protein N terminal region [Insolitispirillum peregrinum]